MDEKRTFELSKKTAKEWYKQGGELRQVALQVFKEEELKEITYKDICESLFYHKDYYDTNKFGDIQATNGRLKDFITCPNNATTKQQLKKLLAINKLANVAKYLNEGWWPVWSIYHNQPKWYLYYNHETHSISIDSTYNCSSGQIYFRNQDLAKQAIEILGIDIIHLALAQNW